MQNEVQIGKNIDYLASQIVSKNSLLGGANLVLSGEPVVIGDLVGCAASSAVASTDLIDVQHVGVFNFSVTPAGATAVGARVYIDPATGIITDNNAKTFFGWALAAIAAGVATLVPVRLKH